MQSKDETITKNKLSKKKILLIVLIWLLSVIILVSVILGIVLGTMKHMTPDEFMVETENYFDYQKHYECSGYASAYVLRSLGVEIDGISLYDDFTNKNADGTLPPKYLKKNLERMGYKCSLKSASFNTLKYDLSRGVPVVVLIRISENSPYLHYVALVGYDNENLYVSDSLDYMKNADNESYNRVIKEDEFKKLWKSYPESINNTYLIIGLK